MQCTRARTLGVFVLYMPISPLLSAMAADLLISLPVQSRPLPYLEKHLAGVFNVLLDFDKKLRGLSAIQ